MTAGAETKQDGEGAVSLCSASSASETIMGAMTQGNGRRGGPLGRGGLITLPGRLRRTDAASARRESQRGRRTTRGQKGGMERWPCQPSPIPASLKGVQSAAHS